MRDPYLILGVPAQADDATIHAAYMAAVRACPPERDAARFQAVRTAYEAIRTRKDRLAYELFDTCTPGISDLLNAAAPIAEPRRPTQEVFAALLRGER
jgi:curved DNA-binding protein CbpA